MLITIQQKVEEDGRLVLTGLPVQAGDAVEITLRIDEPEDDGNGKETAHGAAPARFATVQDWLDSGMIGIWADRDDIGDSIDFVNKLRREEDERIARKLGLSD